MLSSHINIDFPSDLFRSLFRPKFCKHCYLWNCASRPWWSSGYCAFHWTQGSRSGRERWILRAIKILSTTSLGEEIKTSALKILRYGKDPYRMKEILVVKIHWYSIFSCFATRCFFCYCQRAVVGETGTITQMGKHNGCSVWDALCDTTRKQ
jgi:hypothetical protein